MDELLKTSERLRRLIKEKHISYTELERLSGVPKSAIQRYASGYTKKIPLDRIFQIAEALAVSPFEIAGMDRPWGTDQYLGTEWAKWELNKSTKLPNKITPTSDLHHQRVPMIGGTAAGEPIYDPEEIGIYVYSPVDADAAMTVQGDSMSPTYLDGDVIYIKCCPEVPDGTIAVVFLDNEATLKHIYKHSTGLTLTSDNSDYPPISVKFSDYNNVRIFGVPVGYTRMFKS